MKKKIGAILLVVALALALVVPAAPVVASPAWQLVGSASGGLWVTWYSPFFDVEKDYDGSTAHLRVVPQLYDDGTYQFDGSLETVNFYVDADNSDSASAGDFMLEYWHSAGNAAYHYHDGTSWQYGSVVSIVSLVLPPGMTVDWDDGSFPAYVELGIPDTMIPTGEIGLMIYAVSYSAVTNYSASPGPGYGSLFDYTTYADVVFFNILDVACSADGTICKEVKYLDEDGDGLIETGEMINFFVVIVVDNNSGEDWTDVTVKDRFGAELGVALATIGASNPTQGSFTPYTKGRSEKVFLEWAVGTLAGGATATLVLDVDTDLDPGGYQCYTETDTHEFNSGATLKYRDERNKKQSATTGSVSLEVVWDLVGDWSVVYTQYYPGPGGPWTHAMSIDAENPDGSFTGTGTYPSVWTYSVSGDVTGNSVSMTLVYNEAPITMSLTGIVVDENTMTGTAIQNNGNEYTWTATRMP